MIFGIMGAMPDEVDQLCARLENVTVEPYGGVEYHKGTLAGKQVVVCCAGMGKANAAATTQVLITKFGAEKIIFSGIAGNMTSKIGIGDVVIGKTVLYHDAQRKVLSHYDNATLYNDSIVAEIVKRFQKEDAVIIYVPDHGEE